MVAQKSLYATLQKHAEGERPVHPLEDEDVEAGDADADGRHREPVIRLPPFSGVRGASSFCAHACPFCLVASQGCLLWSIECEPVIRPSALQRRLRCVHVRNLSFGQGVSRVYIGCFSRGNRGVLVPDPTVPCMPPLYHNCAPASVSPLQLRHDY